MTEPDRRKGLDLFLLPLALLGAAGLALGLLASAPWWRRRRRARLRRLAPGSEPRVKLGIGYTRIDQAEAKGLLYDLDIWFNPGGFFNRSIYYVVTGRQAIERPLGPHIDYVEQAPPLGAALPYSGTVLGLALGAWRVTLLSERTQADVIHVFGPNVAAVSAFLARLATGIPCLVFIEAFWEQVLPFQTNLPRAVRRMLPWWYRIVYRAFDGFTGGPSMYPDDYAHLGLPRERIHPFLNNVDVADLRERAAATNLPAEVAALPRPWIVTVGRLHAEKLSTDTIAMLVALRAGGCDARLVLVGDGAGRAEVEAAVAAAGLAPFVTLTGALPVAQAMAVVGQADMYFAPYQGNALVEAMAMGCPIVAYDNPPHRVFATQGVTATLVPHRDAAAGAREIARLLADRPAAQRLAEAAQAHVLATYARENVNRTAIEPFRRLFAADLARSHA
jgi:glycosyltransferase involved in cell wall biosynthesis